jgi:pyrimidine-nucleoside phosphorylase/thymidine phosphorylase
MRAVDILHKKKRGLALERDEIAFLIDGFTAGDIPSYQVSAFLMAVSLNGMTTAETRALTQTMLSSGTIFDLSDISGQKVDKHSTGGVGDKTSLIVAPLAAAAGIRVPMISGRALGHSGGTLDKLEAIPGFDVGLDQERFKHLVGTVGCAIIGQTDDIAPADRKLYALRDVTATIDSLPLITGSILSKKLAEGISALVLDVKFGSGAFMKTVDDARALARLLLDTATHMGKKATALLTDMNQPLGNYVGNALEVEEAIAVLRGEGASDLTRLSLELTAHMLVLGAKASSVETGRVEAERVLTNGAGLQKFEAMVHAQGGDLTRLPKAKRNATVVSLRDGYIATIDTETLGRAAMMLGAGRQTMDDVIDPAAGLIVHKKLTDEVKRGEPLTTLHFNDDANLHEVRELVENAYEIADTPPAPTPLVHDVLTSAERNL